MWFIVDHFHSIKGLAHTYLTFEFGCDACLSFSFESRREKGERYHPWDGMWRAYELYLLVGFERGVTGLRTHGRRNKDYMFRAVTLPGKDKELLFGMIEKLNDLAVNPEWYPPCSPRATPQSSKSSTRWLRGESRSSGVIFFLATPPKRRSS